MHSLLLLRQSNETGRLESRYSQNSENILLEVEGPPEVDDDAPSPKYGLLDGDVPAASISSSLRCCTYLTKLACFEKLVRKIDDSWWYINAGTKVKTFPLSKHFVSVESA
ncbi:hypothetical protein TSUD_321650 [Trifolium subterraneum]|uniref:Uncharacterized protein n=1 Tax=Trifolium subterraneum TaxID=3900 RepID=A0A2Z6N2M3_TRISU|nr:hypothetical protein TSUD_321650 [Trifolium subterraneum]